MKMKDNYSAFSILFGSVFAEGIAVVSRSIESSLFLMLSQVDSSFSNRISCMKKLKLGDALYRRSSKCS